MWEIYNGLPKGTLLLLLLLIIYVIGPLLESKIAESVTSSPAAFTLMFDETNTTQ